VKASVKPQSPNELRSRDLRWMAFGEFYCTKLMFAGRSIAVLVTPQDAANGDRSLTMLHFGGRFIVDLVASESKI